eukprot:CAMPEP_0118690462 /NCGR_PEP_ID=MMETSP0800-20121206/10127_1 /TAXON_ID=210618 ORGANISM="Striatella unipunctata, Strain CCMP2910" /NCGR_SAMPLE_ID=MMETSP0800 /ASSEMBLY_ACC=CAM_ASM_000638 /LENGTH=273 /DNA_ID=CAMNT_0006588111 /DNA_START=85 /DNA_END=906 /DNA_ORIENTATION=-
MALYCRHAGKKWTCGEEFTVLAEGYLNRYRRSKQKQSNRGDDIMGEFLNVFVATGVLVGESIDTYIEASKQYERAEPSDFAPDFDDFYFGYWGNEQELIEMRNGLRNSYPGRLSTDKFYPLPSATWREVLNTTAAEPNLGKSPLLPTGEVSMGGWCDYMRVLPLVAVGGSKVIAITTQREDVTPYIYGATQFMGASDTDLHELFALDEVSDLTLSLGDAGGVWCTNWVGFGNFECDALFEDGYTAPLEVHDEELASYENASPNLGIRGCTPYA